MNKRVNNLILSRVLVQPSSGKDRDSTYGKKVQFWYRVDTLLLPTFLGLPPSFELSFRVINIRGLSVRSFCPHHWSTVVAGLP